jgi:hypothetical protein
MKITDNDTDDGYVAKGPQKCDKLYMGLIQSVLTWLNSLKDLGVDDVNWPELKTEFLEAYGPKFSACIFVV